MDQQAVKQRIIKALPNASVKVEGEGCAFQVRVKSPEFKGLSRLTQQKMVTRLFKDEIASGDLHALSVKTIVADQ